MPQTADRASFFPAIEKRHGQPIAHWIALLTAFPDKKYDAQMAHLQAQHGFSRAHANALVLYCRGSVSAHRVDSLDAYLAAATAPQAATVRAIFAAIAAQHPDLETVIAWNHPMLKDGARYLFGVSVAKQHLTLAPMADGVLDAFRPRLTDYEVNKKTLRVPSDWSVDGVLLCDMVTASRGGEGR
jgi:uncharacterized protein